MRKFFSDLWKGRFLFAIWTRYNIEANYLDSKLGALWIILQPVIETLIYSTVFSLILARKPRGDVPFVVFFLSGMVIWNFFSGSLIRSSSLINSRINLISQIKFPAQALVFVDFFEKLVDFIVAFVILVFLNLFFGYTPTVMYIYVPLILIVLFILTIGTMFILATLGAFVQDVSQISGLVLRFMLYFSGVLISSDMVPQKFSMLLNFNPLFFIIESFRNAIIYSEPPNMQMLFFWGVFSVLLLFSGIYYFVKNERFFSDYQ
jgi:lipopolysaccharide transport system permease protein